MGNVKKTMQGDYKEIVRQARIKVLELIYKAQTSHIGSNFSCIDIMAVLFEKMNLEKDIFVLSAGWKAASLYYFMWTKGLIDEKELDSYCQQIECPKCDETLVSDSLRGQINEYSCEICKDTKKIQSKFIGLSEPVHPFIKFAGGSMGMGLPAAVGFSLAKKLKGEEGNVYVLMSDGEMQCGTTWESALIAVHHKLDNLVVIIDNNGFQAMGKTNEILEVHPWLFLQVLGWCSMEVNGHDHYLIEQKVIDLKESSQLSHKNHKAPKVIIANTIKGKGWKRAEGNNLYHYKNISEDEYKEVLNELENA